MGKHVVTYAEPRGGHSIHLCAVGHDFIYRQPGYVLAQVIPVNSAVRISDDLDGVFHRAIDPLLDHALFPDGEFRILFPKLGKGQYPGGRPLEVSHRALYGDAHYVIFLRDRYAICAGERNTGILQRTVHFTGVAGDQIAHLAVHNLKSGSGGGGTADEQDGEQSESEQGGDLSAPE